MEDEKEKGPSTGIIILGIFIGLVIIGLLLPSEASDLRDGAMRCIEGFCGVERVYDTETTGAFRPRRASTTTLSGILKRGSPPASATTSNKTWWDQFVQAIRNFGTPPIDV